MGKRAGQDGRNKHTFFMYMLYDPTRPAVMFSEEAFGGHLGEHGETATGPQVGALFSFPHCGRFFLFRFFVGQLLKSCGCGWDAGRFEDWTGGRVEQESTVHT